jgi:hypothetical protein
MKWFVALVSIACLIVPRVARAQDDVSTISVSGEAVVKVVPDKVTIHLGIETHDLDIQTAKQKNNDILSAAMKAIEEAGVDDGDVQTAHLSIEPRYKSDYTQKNFLGYFVRNSISVVVHDPDAVEGLITAVLTAGVTHVHGVEFETTEFKKHREEARRLALEAAREKAEKMAAVLGMEVGRPLDIAESGRYGWQYFGSGWGWGRGGGMAQNVLQDAGAAADVSGTLALGKISVRGGVNVRFELE